MDRESAITILENLRRVMDVADSIAPAQERKEALDIAIASLKTDETYQLEYEDRDCVEVVRCKDCKYFEYDHVTVVDGVPLIMAHECCTRWGDGCKSNENGYCFLAEKKEQTDGNDKR